MSRAGVRVAVCTNRPARRDLLGAVLAQAPDALVVSAGYGVDERGALTSMVRALSADGVVLHADGPGLARARNAALAACESAVLALLDDDVRPPEGWRAAMDAAWSEAAADVAAIGGPVLLAFPDGRPAWLGTALDAALGAFALNGGAQELDVTVRTLPGANLSLRTDAARGVGGFWPARGHRHARDWYSEEHAAQRELGGAGWRVRYDPAVAVAREPDVTAAGIVAARLRYGARSRVLGGGRSTTLAARQAVASAAGAALAGARGDRARALERAARAAENAGVIAGPLLAHHEIQPTGPTPFRASVPPAAPSPLARLGRRARARRTGQPRAVVLAYHRVADPVTDTLGLSVTPACFAAQVDVLAAEAGADVVSLAELAGGLRGGSVAGGAVALTFDDGYADNIAAAGVLEAAGLPATIFAVTGHVIRPRAFWWDEVETLLLGPGPRPSALAVALESDRRAWRTVTAEERHAARRHLHLWLQPLAGDAIDAVVAQVRDWAGADAVPPAALDVDGLRLLADRPGIEVGAHTRRHPSLGRRSESVQVEEIAGSRDDLEVLLGAAPQAFSYPFGIPGQDVTDATRRIVAEAGFGHAVLNAAGAVTAATDPLAIPRHMVPDVDGDAFAEWLRARRGLS